jgi:hypothetical protein
LANFKKFHQKIKKCAKFPLFNLVFRKCWLYLWRPSFQDVENIDFSKYWNPRLFVDNTLGEPKEELWQSVQFDDSGQANMVEKKRIKGTFQENLELKHFPFDTQVR